MTGYGLTYANRVLAPFAEQLVIALGNVSGRCVYVVDGDCGVLTGELLGRGVTVTAKTDPGSSELAVAVGTLGIEAAPADTLAAMRAITKGGVVAAVHFTAAAVHEAIAAAALETVGTSVPDLGLTPVAPVPAGCTVTPVFDIARFDSARQFYAALIGERNLDTGLSEVQRRHVLEHCITALQDSTTFDNTILLPVEAELFVWA